MPDAGGSVNWPDTIASGGVLAAACGAWTDVACAALVFAALVAGGDVPRSRAKNATAATPTSNRTPAAASTRRSSPGFGVTPAGVAAVGARGGGGVSTSAGRTSV